jgi:hypothetical protein
MELKISRGNSKIGRVPNLSLLPLETCVPDPPCRDKCYALNCHRMYPKVRSAWQTNLNLWRTDPSDFERQLSAFLDKRRPEMFRFHVGGDIPDPSYSLMLQRVALAFPETSFLCFTRRTWAAPSAPNFRLYRSHWLDEPNWNDPEAPVERKSFVRRKDESTIGRLCPAHCPSCGWLCWKSKQGDRVTFHLH